MMETRDYSFRLNAKSLDSTTGTFTGLASTYGGPPDLQGDIIEPGAFKAAIASQGNGVPLLWAHKQDEPIGLAKMSDSPSGLVINGTLLMTDGGAARAYNFMKAGVIKGISIGYTAPPESSGKVIYGNDGTRTLKELMIHECSVVAVPANPRAQVVTVKSLSQVETLLRSVRPGDMSRDTLDQLQAIDLTLKGLLKKDAGDDCSCDCDSCIAGDCDECDDDCEQCQGDECSGCLAARSAGGTDVDDLKAFAMELKGMVSR
ncbi:HK97 family phage prohead protease [Granulicella sp. S190]|uniref:HK97 family phage prohead protease n=1 Tax=Granulicella sp. S190 TaxID=1747226 RepID=UPI00131C3F54|nr:HK97 family phage prohead protease [Granulicella sp. S190]